MARDVVLYDSDCGFCRWTLSKLLAWDRGRRLQPAAIQSPLGQELLAGLTPEQRMDSWHLVTGDGERYSAGAAFPPLLRRLPLGPPLAVVAGRFPGVTDAAYRWVARNRSMAGRLLPEAAKRRAAERVARREREPAGVPAS